MSAWLCTLGGSIRERKRKQVISREENLRSQRGAGLGQRVGSEQPNQEYTDSRKAGAIRTFITLSVVHSTHVEALADTQQRSPKRTSISSTGILVLPTKMEEPPKSLSYSGSELWTGHSPAGSDRQWLPWKPSLGRWTSWILPTSDWATRPCGLSS